MTQYNTLILTLLFPFSVLCQNIEIQGKLILNKVDTITSGKYVYVSQPDGTVACRDINTLPTAISTQRNWQSDVLLSSIICNCGTLRPPIMQSLLDNGYTVMDLLEFELTILQLYQAEISVQVLRDGGLTVAQLYEGGISIRNLYDGGVTITELHAIGISIQEMLNIDIAPISLYNAGFPMDSLIGKEYVEGLIFYMDVSTGDGMVVHHVGGALGWGCDTLTVGANGTAIGTGFTNTQIMREPWPNCLVAPGNNPYQTSIPLEVNEFFPSLDELLLMYDTVGPGAAAPNTNIAGFDNDRKYWTSTEIDGHFAYSVNFADRSIINDLKTWYNPILPATIIARTFSGI